MRSTPSPLERLGEVKKSPAIILQGVYNLFIEKEIIQ